MKQTIAENLFNKEKHHLSASAKKRLKWMYILHYRIKLYKINKNNGVGFDFWGGMVAIPKLQKIV